MATPRVLGQLLRLTANLCLAREASAAELATVYISVEWGPHTEQRLVSPTTSSDDTNHSTDGALDHLLCARRKLDARLALIRVVADNGDVVSGSAAELKIMSAILSYFNCVECLTAPRSPTFSSTLLTTVPSGTAPRGRTLPTVRAAFLPA
jgi:hypothetical protein